MKSFEDLFDSCGCIESIYFKKFYRNNINNMRFMFLGCLLLKEINLSNFKTNNVTNMGDMFSRCSSLKRLNVSINDYREIAKIEIELKLLMVNMVNLLIYLMKIKNIIISILITQIKKLKEII